MLDVTVKPPLTEFKLCFNGEEIKNDIVTLNSGEKVILSIELSFAAVVECADSKKLPNSILPNFINFCVYETNYSTGKGYRILDFSTTKLDISLNKYSAIRANLLTLDDSLKPMTGGFENSPETPLFDFINSFISLKIFYSFENFSSVQNIDDIFYNTKNIIIDTRVPFKQVNK